MGSMRIYTGYMRVYSGSMRVYTMSMRGLHWVYEGSTLGL